MEIKRYDIIQVDLNGSIGSEQGGIRPALVIQNDVGNTYSMTTIIMPLSTKIKALNQPTHTIIKKSANTGLKMDSMVLGEQMRVISKDRILKKIGEVQNDDEKEKIKSVYYANFGI